MPSTLTEVTVEPTPVSVRVLPSSHEAGNMNRSLPFVVVRPQSAVGSHVGRAPVIASGWRPIHWPTPSRTFWSKGSKEPSPLGPTLKSNWPLEATEFTRLSTVRLMRTGRFSSERFARNEGVQ